MNYFTSKLVGLVSCILLVGICFTSPVFAQSKTIEYTTHSDEARQLFLEGRDLIENAEIEKAMESFEKALSLDQDFILAEVYLKTFPYTKESIAKFAEKVEANKANISEGEYLIFQFLKFYYEKENKNFIATTTKLVELYPDDAWANMAKGRSSYFIEKDKVTGQKYLEAAKKLKGDCGQIYNSLGYLYMYDKEWDKAEENFKIYIEKGPDWANPYDSYAEFWLNKGDYDKSIKYYSKALEIKPDFFASIVGLGNNYMHKAQYSKARDAYMKFKLTDKNSKNAIDIKYKISQTYILENNIEQAQKVLDDIYKLAEKNGMKPGMVIALAQKGFLLMENGNVKMGEEYYKKAIAIGEENNLEKMNAAFAAWKAYCLINNGDNSGCKKQLEELKKMADASGDKEQLAMYETLTGLHFVKEKKYDEACKYLEKGFDNAIGWYWLGVAYSKNGNKDKAKEYFDKLKENKVFSNNFAVYFAKAKREKYI